MPAINTREGQSLVDIAMQESGRAERLFDYAVANGMSITEALQVDQSIQTLEVDVRSVVAVLTVIPNHPASDSDDAGDALETGEGIGFWYLNEYIVQ